MKRQLGAMAFLVVDCQATSADPHGGHLLEVGWAVHGHHATGRRSPPNHESHMVLVPDDAVIPARVTRVTGITDNDLVQGRPPREVWKRLFAATRRVAHANRMRRCPTIIHFARFERPFLEMLHDEYGTGAAFPFDIICTHEIARRLYPELPRRGIKALAGYFGYASKETRRSHDHVLATACIWENLRAVLTREYNVTTYGELKRWLDRTPVRKFASRGYPMKDRYRRHLPDAPGVYRMCRTESDILYIGKARSLKKRVNSYFKKRGHLAGHILDMLTQARRIEIIETGSALEAALLESDQIKEHSPPYNVALRTRERAVMYCDSAYGEFSAAPSRQFRIGPLTSRDPLYRLSLLKPLIIMAGSGADEGTVHRALTLDGSYGPGIDEVAKGIEIFLDRHRDVLTREPADYALMRLGKQLWLLGGDTVDIEDDDGDHGVETIIEWSPEHVARALENVLIRSMYTLRRARLCVLLTESSIAWEERHGQQSTRRYIVLEGGVVVERGNLQRKRIPPVPPGFARTFLERQQAFDVATVDRLRVLITELRRLVNARQWVRIRLRARAVLDNAKLERIFEWV